MIELKIVIGHPNISHVLTFTLEIYIFACEFIHALL